MSTTTAAAPAETDILDDKPQEVKADMRKFNKAKDQVDKALVALGKITVLATQAEVDLAKEVIQKANTVEKMIEAKRMELVKPWNEEVKKINAFAKELTAKIGPAVTKAKGAILEFVKAEEKRKLDERTDARKKHLVSLEFTEDGDVYASHGFTIRLTHITSLDDAGWAAEMKAYSDHLEKRKQESIQSLQSLKDNADFFGEEAPEIEEQINQVRMTELPKAPVHIPSFGGGSSKKASNGLTKTWTHELIDINLVPAEYLQLDTAKITAAIRSGVRDIAGVKIYQKESITIR